MSSFLTVGSIDSSSVDRTRRSIRFFNFSTAFGKGFSVATDDDEFIFFFGVAAKSLSDEAFVMAGRFGAIFFDFSLVVAVPAFVCSAFEVDGDFESIAFL